MGIYKISDFSFKYPEQDAPVLNEVNFQIPAGEFVVICGRSGSGKSTLLRSLKPIISPYGAKSGEIRFKDELLDDIPFDEQSRNIGYMLQNPDNQIVTDKVWHELAFGMESQGFPQEVIRKRVAEMASFFGIQGWFRDQVSGLSGGQKQILSLASIMSMQPDVLILDEPTAQLDPIAAMNFLEAVSKINREIGTTVIIAEQRLEDVFALADRVVVLEAGRVIADAPPRQVGIKLMSENNAMYASMPAPLQVYMGLEREQRVKLSENDEHESPITVRDGKEWLSRRFSNIEIRERSIGKTEIIGGETTVSLKDVWFRYGKDKGDVVRDLSFSALAGQIYCIVGGNGVGKSTALKLIAGIKKPYRGKITVTGRVGMLPQDPQLLFTEKTVELDVRETFSGDVFKKEEKPDKEKMELQLQDVMSFMELEHLRYRHPYDLSGGEQQRAALAKVLLTSPDILLLDEPTKGMDIYFKDHFAEKLRALADTGKTVIIVSHDVEFCAKYADVCALFFDGGIVSTADPREFFSGNYFYTTASSRISRHLFENAVTVKDIIELCKRNKMQP